MRAVIGEDQALMREGLALLLERDGFDVVARVDDADALVRAARSYQPELVVADIRMPPNNADDGLGAALEIRRTSSSTPGLSGSAICSSSVLQTSRRSARTCGGSARAAWCSIRRSSRR